MRSIRLVALLTLALVPAMVWAVGGKESSAAEPAQTVIRFTWFTDGPDKAAIEAVIADYMSANPNVTVELSIVPYAELNQLLATQASGGQAPDLARVTEPYRFFDYALDLTPYVSPGFADQFLKGSMMMVRAPSGALVGFPHDLTMNGPFINVSLFKKAGIPVPTGKVTWESLFEAASAVQKATGVPYAVAADRSGHRLDGIVQSYGASFFTPDGKALNLQSANTTGAFKYFVDLHKQGIMPLEIWAGGSGYVGGNQQFINGQLVMYISGNWQVAQFASTIGDKFEWAAIPNGFNAQSGGMPGGKFVMAFKGKTDPKEVGKFAEYLGSKAAVEKYASMAMFLPARNDLIASGVAYPVRTDVMNVFSAGLAMMPATAYSDNYHLKFGPVANVVRDRLTQAIADEISFDEAMTRMQREAEELMK
ncbi:MAG: extracellular solute-binding protein [Spirochaetales bacterium]|nr:extracellular solute-binding protein [Spirochaetales bacterium]